MSLPILVVDVDDILCPLNEHLQQWHTDHYAPVCLADVTSFKLHETWRCTIVEAKRRVAEFELTGAFALLPPILVMQAAITRLAATFRLVAITGRPARLYSVTAHWLRAHYPEIGQLHLIDHSPELEDFSPRKGQMCTELSAFAAIEDAPFHAKSMLDIGVPVVMPTLPWNKSFKHELLHRVASHADVEATVLGLWQQALVKA